MNKKTYFEKLCELSYSCALANHGYVAKDGTMRHTRHIGK